MVFMFVVVLQWLCVVVLYCSVDKLDLNLCINKRFRQQFSMMTERVLEFMSL